MELVVNLSREDIWQFHKFANWRTMYKKLSLILDVLTYPLILVFLQVMINVPMSRIIGLTLFITVLWIPAYFWLLKSRVKKAPSDRGCQLGIRIVGITPDRICEKAAHYEEFHLWKGILDIAQNHGYIFLFVDTYRAFLIPKRSFSTASEAQVFFDTALSHWKAARTQDNLVQPAGK
jgi:hypothetical protein